MRDATMLSSTCNHVKFCVVAHVKLATKMDSYSTFLCVSYVCACLLEMLIYGIYMS